MEDFKVSRNLQPGYNLLSVQNDVAIALIRDTLIVKYIS